jgi:hypothetical protein
MYRHLLLLFLPFVLLGGELEDYLKQYEGRWLGEYTIHSPSTNFTGTFPVEQRYWMEDGQLRGLSVSDTDRGIQTAKSRTFIKEGVVYSEVTAGDNIEKYIGALHEGGLVWLPSNLKRANDYQMKESFVKKAQQFWLHTDGFDSYVYREGLGHLVYRGRLLFVPEK